MNPIVTTTEIKSHLGIATSAEDTKIAMWNKMAADQLCQLLGTADLAIHQVSEERHDGGKTLIELNDLNPRAITQILEGATEYAQDEPYDLEDGLLRLTSALACGKREGKVSYVAGWFPGGWATVSVTANDDLENGDEITITPSGTGDGTVLAAGDDFEIGADAAETAANIAEAINGQPGVSGVAGIFAFADGEDITIGDLTVGRLTTTWEFDGTGLTASATLSAAPDMPEGLRLAALLLIAGIRGKAKAGGMSQYTIGGKHVQFASAADADQFKDAIAPYDKPGVYA